MNLWRTWNERNGLELGLGLSELNEGCECGVNSDEGKGNRFANRTEEERKRNE